MFECKTKSAYINCRLVDIENIVLFSVFNNGIYFFCKMLSL